MAFRLINTPIMATRTKRRSGGAEFQYSVSHAAATSFPASSTAPIVMMGQKAPAKIAVRPSIEKAADTQASASATINAATLTSVMDRRGTAVCDMAVTLSVPATVGVTSVTVGVTALMSVIASALRRISPAFSHAFSRRPVRILFQPHRRPSSAALAVTRPYGGGRGPGGGAV